MSLVEHAKREFEALGWPGDCEMQKMICDNIIELLEVFSKQGHSGSSAPYALKYFTELAKFNPVSPLTGEDSEWVEVGEGHWQNKRDGEVFKDSNGSTYWIHGKIFRDPDGCCYTNKGSCIPVEFPWFKPEPIYVDVDTDGNPIVKTEQDKQVEELNKAINWALGMDTEHEVPFSPPESANRYWWRKELSKLRDKAMGFVKHESL